MADLLTTLHPINDANTDLYPNVKNENIPSVISGKDAMEALEGSFDTLRTDEMQIGGDNGTIINSTQIATPNKVINLDEIVDDAELAQGLSGKVDKVQGKGLSTNDFTNADKTLVDTIPDKVNKEQGKGLSTNDFTNEYKKDLDQDIPDQIQLFKDAFEETAIAINGKVDKVSGKGLSTNDYTNADKLLVDSIPDKVDKVQGKGLSTNDFTNADKAYLDNLPNYFISLAKGGVVNVADADMPANSNTPYFGAKHGTTSHFTLAEGASSIKVTSPQYSTWASIAVNGAGGVNLVSNRDGVSSAILSAGNFKVTADQLVDGDHIKTTLEVNYVDGVSVSDIREGVTKTVNLPFHEIVMNEDQITTNSDFQDLRYVPNDPNSPILVDAGDIDPSDLSVICYVYRVGLELKLILRWFNSGTLDIHPIIKVKLPHDYLNNAFDVHDSDDGFIYGAFDIRQFNTLDNTINFDYSEQKVLVYEDSNDTDTLTFEFDENVTEKCGGSFTFTTILGGGR